MVSADAICANKMFIGLPYLWNVEEGNKFQAIIRNHACFTLAVQQCRYVLQDAVFLSRSVDEPVIDGDVAFDSIAEKKEAQSLLSSIQN